MRSLDKHTARDKQLLRLERELRRLWQATNDSPLVPLERPIHRGWKKFYVLRADVLRRPDRRIFAEVLPFVNDIVYSRTRSFRYRNGHPIVLVPRLIDLRKWNKLRWPVSHQRLFSFGNWKRHQHLPRPRREYGRDVGFKLVRTWWLEETIQPWLVTHVHVDLPDVCRRLDEIERPMRHTDGWERVGWLHGRHVHWAHWDGSVAHRETIWDHEAGEADDV